MPQIDVIDSTWLAARPSVVGPVMADPANWRRWWPMLELEVHETRGPKGVRWLVRSVRGAEDVGLAGSAEVWLEPMAEGVVAHLFLRLDPAPGRRLPASRARRIEDSIRRPTKRAFWALADHFDPGRAGRLTSTSRG